MHLKCGGGYEDMGCVLGMGVVKEPTL